MKGAYIGASKHTLRVVRKKSLGSPCLYQRAPILSFAFNAASFIAETGQSVQRQTFSAWEQFVVDGGSTVATAAEVERVAGWHALKAGCHHWVSRVLSRRPARPISDRG
ncbi:glycosyltransferase [Roseovarius pacificus]|uniref:glycosyltransferase n=1 Tax=Roseovarius pacificus TaxID=337701 RepID=UPI00403A59B8